MPMPESRAITLPAAPGCSAGASSTINAVTTPATSTSKQPAKSLKKARNAIDGANPLTKFAGDEPATPTAIRRLRPNRSARVDRGSAPSAPSASTDPSSESASVLAWNSIATAGGGVMSTEPLEVGKTTPAPGQISRQPWRGDRVAEAGGRGCH